MRRLAAGALVVLAACSGGVADPVPQSLLEATTAVEVALGDDPLRWLTITDEVAVVRIMATLAVPLETADARLCGDRIIVRFADEDGEVRQMFYECDETTPILTGNDVFGPDVVRAPAGFVGELRPLIARLRG